MYLIFFGLFGDMVALFLVTIWQESGEVNSDLACVY